MSCSWPTSAPPFRGAEAGRRHTPSPGPAGITAVTVSVMIPRGVPAAEPEPRTAGRLGPSSIFKSPNSSGGEQGEPAGGRSSPHPWERERPARSCRIERRSERDARTPRHPTLARPLGCGPIRRFDVPVALESAADHRPPTAHKIRAPGPTWPAGGACDYRIVIGMRERHRAWCGLTRPYDLVFCGFCGHCPPHTSAHRGGRAKQPA
jgi:hypothetical protein